MSASTAIHRDKMRVIEVAFQFIEAGSPVFPSTIIATVVAVLAAADSALTASRTDLGGTAIPAAAAGPAVTGEGQTVVTSFAAATIAGGSQPNGDRRHGCGAPAARCQYLLRPLWRGLGLDHACRSAPRSRRSRPNSPISAPRWPWLRLEPPQPLARIPPAPTCPTPWRRWWRRCGPVSPILPTRCRSCSRLPGFTFSDSAGGTVGIGAAMAAMRDAMAAACRRAALVSLARASASYQPSSYNDAAALRVVLAAALDNEITAAGDAGEDASYTALKALRSAVVQDLTVRGASLPSVVTVNLQLPLPSLVIAQRLYLDASRSDQIAARIRRDPSGVLPDNFSGVGLGHRSDSEPEL